MASTCNNCGGCCADICLSNELHPKCIQCGCTEVVALGPNQSLLKGTALAFDPATNSHVPLAMEATDETREIRGFLSQDVETDADGKIKTSRVLNVGCGAESVSIYTCGTFDASVLNAANPVGTLQFIRSTGHGRFVSGMNSFRLY